MLAKIWHKTWNALNYLYGTMQFGSKRQLHALKGIHTGKRCFIIGNGPSLRNEDLRKLNEYNEYTFACNSLIKLFNEIPFYPTYYFAQDNKIILDNKQEITDLHSVTRFIKAHYAKRYHIKGGIYYSMLFPKNPIGFSTNLPRTVYSGQTVTYSMIQFAAYMGFTEIYLLGVDCNYSTGNSVITADSYFDKRLFNKNRTYAPPEVDTNLLAFERAGEVCEPRGIHIFNATRGGKLEVFPRVDFDKLFRKE